MITASNPLSKVMNFSTRYFQSDRKITLVNKIFRLAHEMKIYKKDAKRVVSHVVSDFSKNGIDGDYIGYHDIIHELEVTYFTMLAAKFHFEKNKFNQNDVNTLFVAALLHDFDPSKEFEKPHNDNVETYIRNDNDLAKFIVPFEIDLNIVIALIYRTTYPFSEKEKEHALERMQDLFSLSGIHKGNTTTRDHYEELGWFLSICDRVAGYALRDFKDATELARRNAYSMGWNASVINEEIVKYFTTLKDEKKMLDHVLKGVPDDYRKNLFNNIAEFRRAWENEIRTKSLARKKEGSE